MAKITVDGEEHEVQDGLTLLQALQFGLVGVAIRLG